MALTFENSEISNDGEEVSSGSIQQLFGVADDLEMANVPKNIESSVKRLQVYLRVRPVPISSPRYQFKNLNLAINQTNGKTECFEFDKIIHGSDQFRMFQDTALPLLKHFIQGDNSLILTSGVTSSGKTFTMRGTNNNPGMVPLSLISLFAAIPHGLGVDLPRYKPIGFCDRIRLSEFDKQNEEDLRRYIIQQILPEYRGQASFFQENEEQILNEHKSVFDQLRGLFSSNNSQLEVSIWVSYVEIYNDVLIDLLATKPIGQKQQQQGQPKLNLIQDGTNYYIHGLRSIFVNTATEAFLVYLFGQHNLRQHISKTILNEQSSRSHSIFRLTMVKVDESVQQSITSHIDFCDLAGSERILKTGNVGVARVAETKKINQSLSALNFCLKTLKDRQLPMVPFRNSKLTHVLQPYLCSNGGMVVLIINLNPSPQLFEESVYSLNLCDAVKAMPTKALQRAVRRLTLAPNTFGFIGNGYEEEEELDEISEDPQSSSQWEVESQSILANYEERISEFEQREKQFFKLIDDMKADQERRLQHYHQDLEDQRDMFEARMAAQKKEFEDDMEEIQKKCDELETKLFESESERQIANVKLDEFQLELDRKNNEIEDLKKSKNVQIKELEKLLEMNRNELNVQKNNVQQLQKTLEEKEKLLESYRGRLEMAESKQVEQSLRSSLEDDDLNQSVLRSIKKIKKPCEKSTPPNQRRRVLAQKQTSSKLKIKSQSMNDVLSPDSIFTEIKSEQKAAADEENRNPVYSLRSKRNLRF